MQLVHIELPGAVWNVWSQLKHESKPIKNTVRHTSVICLPVTTTALRSSLCVLDTAEPATIYQKKINDAPVLPGIIMMKIEPQKKKKFSLSKMASHL